MLMTSSTAARGRGGTGGGGGGGGEGQDGMGGRRRGEVSQGPNYCNRPLQGWGAAEP